MRTSRIGITITISLSLLALSAQAQTPTFTAASVLNAASMASGPIAPGMVAAITGSNLGDATFGGNCMNVTPLPATCNAVSVLVNGAPAPKLFDSASEVTFQVPSNISGSTATIQVTLTLSGHSLSSAVVTVPVAPTAPGLFSVTGLGTGTGYYLDTSGLVAEYSQPVLPGDTVVLFATGFGVTTPAVATGTLAPNAGASAAATVTMTVNNQAVTPSYSGLEPGNQSGAVIGYDEVVFKVPSTLTVPAGSKTVSFPVVVTVGGVASPPVNVIVAAPVPSITSVSPSPVLPSNCAQVMTFTGTAFQNGLTLELESPAKQKTTVPASDITFISSTQFTAVITFGMTGGTWSALVTNPDGTATSVFAFTESSTVPTPVITSVVTTYGNEASQSPQIAQNTWIEVHGTNLSQVTTSWSTLPASAFATSLPTALGCVSATVDNIAAAVYYVSPTQINILAPLNSATGTVPVQVNTPYGETAIKTVTELQSSPAFLVLDTAGHVAALHLDYSYLGPASFGASFTPAKAGETVLLYATGFGQTNPPITNQLTGLGALPALPTVTIGNLPATVSYAGISAAGLYQFTVIVPASAPSGDLALLASYNGGSTQSNTVITVQ